MGIDIQSSSGAIQTMKPHSYRRGDAMSLSSDSRSSISFLSEPIGLNPPHNSALNLSLGQEQDIPSSSSQPLHLTGLTSSTAHRSVTFGSTSEIEFCIPPESVRLKLLSDMAPISLNQHQLREEEEEEESVVLTDSPVLGAHPSTTQELPNEEQSMLSTSHSSEIKIPTTDTKFHRLTSTPRFEQGPMKEGQKCQQSSGTSDDRYRELPELEASDINVTTVRSTEHYTREQSSSSTNVIPSCHSVLTSRMELSETDLTIIRENMPSSSSNISLTDLSGNTDTNIPTSIGDTAHSSSVYMATSTLETVSTATKADTEEPTADETHSSYSDIS
jgi:hypothetical protein